MAKINQNLANTTINTAYQGTSDTATAGIITLLRAYLYTLTNEEHQSLFSLAKENLVLPQDALTQTQVLGKLIPTELSGLVTNLENYLKLFQQLDTLEKDSINQIAQQVADINRTVAHETYASHWQFTKILRHWLLLAQQKQNRPTII